MISFGLLTIALKSLEVGPAYVAWTGLGTMSLAIPQLPHVGAPDIAEFGWAIVIGLAAAPVGAGIRWLALFLRPHVERRMVLVTPLAGLAVAGLAIAFAAVTGKGSSEVLFSGQDALGPLIHNSAGYTVGALLLLMACKSVAYGTSMSSPVIPRRLRLSWKIEVPFPISMIGVWPASKITSVASLKLTLLPR